MVNKRVSAVPSDFAGIVEGDGDIPLEVQIERHHYLAANGADLHGFDTGHTLVFLGGMSATWRRCW